ncbi:MAG: hypothetical protein F6K09_11735, partial [Merismopedia sp. SIO2A8]|nr:hypothetical protein [Merismopedia sp. SIO2A8]
MRGIESIALVLIIALAELMMSNPASSQQENQFLANSIVNYTKNNDYLEKLPPLIEREVFFGNP